MGNPLVYEGIVYAGITDNNTRAFNATTGHYEWGYKTGGPVYSSPAADGDILFFGSDDTKLYALDVSGAAPVSLWNFTANGAIRSTPTINGNKVFFGSDNNMLYTVNKMTGELIWSWATTTPSAKIGNGVAVANDIVYVTSADLPKVYALHVDVAPGNYTENDFDIRYWTKDLKTPLSGSISGLNEPIYAGGKIIVTSTGGDPAMLWSLDADVGNVLWDRGWKWWPSFGNAVVADGHVWFNIFWWDPGSYAMVCIGDLFPPTTYLYTVNARGTSYNVALETNSTITNFNTANLETQGKIGFNVQGIGTSGMCNITLPDAMLGEPFNVTVGGEQPFYVAEPTGNGTHTWLYFTYNHTTSQTVEITGTIPPTTYHYTVSAGGTSFDVALETNSTVTNFNTTALETEKKITFGVAGINETTGMCNITIPNDMLDGELNVTVDGEQPLYSAAPLNNGTHTSLYFTYNNTMPHAVEITGTTVIPEFPIIAALPMLITTLFMTLVQLKRKHNK
jgi:outer membrane protein assembly factor BamB